MKAVVMHREGRCHALRRPLSRVEKAVNAVRLDGLSVQEWRTALIGSADCKPRRNEEKPRRTGCEGWLVEQEIDTGGFHQEHA